MVWRSLLLFVELGKRPKNPQLQRIAGDFWNAFLVEGSRELSKKWTRWPLEKKRKIWIPVGCCFLFSTKKSWTVLSEMSKVYDHFPTKWSSKWTMRVGFQHQTRKKSCTKLFWQAGACGAASSLTSYSFFLIAEEMQRLGGLEEGPTKRKT